MIGRGGASLEEIEALYRGRFEVFARVAGSVTGDAERARDAVQEAFATAVSRRRSFRGDGPLEAWVWRIVLNGARSDVRRRVPPADCEGHMNGNGYPERDAELRIALARLPERQRTAVFLRYYADLSYASIGEALGITEGTVAATLNAALTTLRTRLQEVRVTELDPTILESLLPPTPGSPDWDDVMRRSGSRGRDRRRQLVALVAAALVVAAGTAWALGPVRTFFWSARENSRIAYLHDGGLYVMDADGSGQELLARDVGCCVAWSADGRTLAYTVQDDGVWVVRTERSHFGWNKASSRPWRLAPDGGFPTWSPDMWHIAYSAEGGIFVVGADGSGRRRLVADGAAPLWSPDGRRIAFLRGGDLWVMDADGTGQRNLTDSPLETEAEAQWSPDGRTILFERQAEALDVGTRATGATTEIVVTTADGGKERRLTSNSDYDGRASWSPDGQRIVFVCGSVDARVCVMNDDGTGRRDLGARTSRDWPVAWSPDGKQIAYTARDGSQVEVMSSDGSDKHRLPRSPTGEVFVAWAPDSLFEFRPPPG